MSEKVLRILLGELVKVRVLCQTKDCDGVIELPLHKIGKSTKCPLCQESFMIREGQNERNFLREMAHAMGELDRAKARFKVEFVIPEKS